MTLLEPGQPSEMSYSAEEPMGWELRKGRWYLYRNKRVNGKPVNPLRGLKSYQQRADEDPRRKEIP